MAYTLASAKRWLDVIQATLTCAGIIVGGLWTYILFVKDREDNWQATLEQSVTSATLAPDGHIVQVTLSIRNTGHTLMHVTKAQVAIQRVLPLVGCSGKCVVKELNSALARSERTADRFGWSRECILGFKTIN